MTDQPPASAGGAPTPARSIVKDAPWVRFVIGGLLLVLAAAVLGGVYVLGWHKWPEAVDRDLIDALKVIAIAALVGLILMAGAFASPWLGVMKITGGPLSIEEDGRQ